MRWTKEEISFLKDNYSGKTLDHLASILKRSEKSIFEKAGQEGLLSKKEGAKKFTTVNINLSQDDVDILKEVHPDLTQALKICIKTLNPEFKIKLETNKICNKLHINLSDLKLRNRTRNIVEKRILIMAALRSRGYSYGAIARQLDMNHATVIHHLKRH